MRTMSRLYDLQKFCRAGGDWLIDTTEALVRLESPTTDKAAVDRCGRELASRLETMGGRVTRLSRPDRGDHLLAEFGCGSSQILLLGHFDTVWPIGQLEHIPLTRTNRRLHRPRALPVHLVSISACMAGAQAPLSMAVRVGGGRRSKVFPAGPRPGVDVRGRGGADAVGVDTATGGRAPAAPRTTVWVGGGGDRPP